MDTVMLLSACQALTKAGQQMEERFQHFLEMMAGKNKINNIRLYNSNMIDRMTAAQSNVNSVVVGFFASSFLGRNNGRFVWDVALPGTSFSYVIANAISYPITNSTITDDWQTSISAFGSGYEFKEDITKGGIAATRMRVRVRYELSTALTGQVYGPWRTVPEYLIYLQTVTPPQLASQPEETEIFAPQSSEYKDQVSVYPNPVTDRLFIQSTNMDQVKSLQLVSANGTMAFTSTKPQSEVDVKHLPAGSYILVINKKDGSKTSHKVLIRK
jgi:hypothetical protein